MIPKFLWLIWFYTWAADLISSSGRCLIKQCLLQTLQYLILEDLERKILSGSFASFSFVATEIDNKWQTLQFALPGVLCSSRYS
jgi:hypothetical protein